MPDAAPSAPTIRLPAVDKVLQHSAMQSLYAQYGQSACTQAVREALAQWREQWRDGQALPSPEALAPEAIAGQARQRLERRFAPRLQTVFNLTGTVLHTNLGRALLPQEAIDAVVLAMAEPANLEYDLETGGRGDRDDLIESLICELTGAEAATVVNNNAAAVLIALGTLAQGKEAIVSRGELVEIGGAFRIPDVMTRAGARLVEVGTTNRTHAADYAEAIGDNTALLMKVHCSNYAITGFTKAVSDAEVAQLAHDKGLPMMVDLGSGTLVDLRDYGLPYETTVRESVQAGADLVTFSGDKLLGGPQAGLIVGRSDLIAQIKKNPLKRALRVGKLTLAALEATLRLYLHPEQLAQRLTTLRLLTRSAAEIQTQADAIAPVLGQLLGADMQVQSVAMFSQIGSGALPVDSLPSWGLKISPAPGRQAARQLQALEARFRALPQPVIGRLQDNAMWLDLRCLPAHAQDRFVQQLSTLAHTPA